MLSVPNLPGIPSLLQRLSLLRPL